MAYYVRKFARAKWVLMNQDAEKNIGNYCADAIANDMRTTGNTLSLWKAESLNTEDINPIIIINSLMGDNIKTIDLMFIPEEMMSKYALRQEDGDTVLFKYKSLHYNVTSLSIKRLIDFASDVVLTILLESESNPLCLVKRVKERDQLSLISDWIDCGKLNYEDLKDSQKKALDKYRNR